jgi:hypothetical protein
MRMRDIIMEGEESKNVTINIPITITIPAGGGMPTIGTIAAPADVNDLPDVPVYVSPLQQELELLKQQGGKKSKVINQVIADTGADSKMDEQFDAAAEYAKKNYFSLSEDFDELANQFDRLAESEQHSTDQD